MLFKCIESPGQLKRSRKESVLSIKFKSGAKIIVVISSLGKRLTWRLCVGSLLSSAPGIHACGRVKGMQIGRERNLNVTQVQQRSQVNPTGWFFSVGSP